MFNRLNGIKITIILIWEETENDPVYLYYLLKFAICILEGGNT